MLLYLYQLHVESILSTKGSLKQPRYIWNANTHYHLSVKPSVVHILSQKNPINAFFLQFKVHLNVIEPSMSISSV